MPNRSLSYKIEMDTRTAVRDLQRLTREGRKAGEDIADGFDSTETAGTNALRALSRQLDQLEQDAKGTAQAAEAIGRQMSDGYDQSRINGFVADLNRIGVGFDEIEQKAEEFAAVLKRADDTELSSVRGELDQVGEGLDRTRDSGDQSRSVLANLAGNASQDLGELGGVVGSLGVGIGQLAEYAVDGNIALSNLAKVAGPMALLSGGLALVNVAMGRMSKAREADAEAAADWQAAIEESGAGVEGVLQRLTKARQLFTEPSGDVFGFEQWLFGEDPIDVIGAMQTIGLSADQLAEILVDLRDSGQEFSRDTFLATPQLQQLASSLLEVGYSGTEASDIFGVIWEEFERFSRGSKEASVNAEFFADSLAGINQAMVTNQESASNLNDLWSKVLDDLADNGVIDDSAGAWNRLRDVLDLSRDGLAELAQQKLDEKLQADADAADELAAATRDMAVAFADARRQIDDILAETPDLAGALAGELDKVDSVLEGLKFDESFDARFQEALDGLRGFEPDLQTLADNWQDVLNGVEIDLLGNVRTDDAEALAAIESLTNIVQEGVVDAFGDGGTDSAQAFLDNLISQISSATGIDPSVLYQLVGAGPPRAGGPPPTARSTP